MDQWLVTKQMPVHLIAACGLVMRDGKVLLLRSKRRGWEFPGTPSLVAQNASPGDKTPAHPLFSLLMLRREGVRGSSVFWDGGFTQEI